MSAGFYDALRPIANHLTHAVILEAALAALWGTTLSGYVIFLWPLTHATHWLIGRLSGVA